MNKKPYLIDENAGLTTLRDPMIMIVGDTYYLTGTQQPYWKGPNAVVHLWSTKDMVHFTDHGNILARADMSEDFWGRDRFWAPELFDGQDGWYYLTFNSKNDKYPEKDLVMSGLARSKTPTGPYEIITKEVPLCAHLGHSNDASLFRDDDGTLYLAFNSRHKQMLHKLNPESGAISDQIIVCGYGPEGDWDSVGVEGACIVKRHGLYFHWYSGWAWGYNAGIMTATDLRGLWTKHPENPFLNPNELWHHCGHNHSFIGPDGKDYIIFHAFLKEPDGEDVPRIFIHRVDYLTEGSVKIYEDLGFGE